MEAAPTPRLLINFNATSGRVLNRAGYYTPNLRGGIKCSVL